MSDLASLPTRPGPPQRRRKPLRLPSAFRYYEVELPGRLSDKADRLTTAGLVPTCDRRPIDADLTGDWHQLVIDAGLRTDEPTLWFAEGLIQYLPKERARNLFHDMHALSATGSAACGDFVDGEFFSEPEHHRMLSRIATLGLSMTSIDDPIHWFAHEGWSAQIFRPSDLLAGSHPFLSIPIPERLAVRRPGIGYFLAKYQP
ncbi:class I SAM-dependent methyltransferase [Nocardia sp. NPDC059240]|uniref:class I SAM-dependent methyltransferase n=1 Tax=Nocardia sp. NPDC059240 TaxID=3346786 RepID=UPI00368099B5